MRNATSGSSGGMREGRVLSRSRPSTPSAMNRSCHLQTQGFDFPVRRTISTVPAPSAVARMIPARQTCRCRLGRAPASPRRGALAFRLVRTSPSTPPAAGSAPRAALPSPKPPTQSPWRLHPAGPASGDFPSALPRTSACLYAGRREPHTPSASRCRGGCHGIDGMRFSASCPPPRATPIMGKAYALRRRRVIRDSYIILHQLVTRVRGVTHRGSSRAPDRAGSYMAPKLVARRDAHTDERIRA